MSFRIVLIHENDSAIMILFYYSFSLPTLYEKNVLQLGVPTKSPPEIIPSILVSEGIYWLVRVPELRVSTVSAGVYWLVRGSLGLVRVFEC